MILSLEACTQKCYEVFPIKEIRYDISALSNAQTVSISNKILEKEIDHMQDNLLHMFDAEYSLSSNYFGAEIINRSTNRRYVKRDSQGFEEKDRYEDNPFIKKAVATGKQKKIGRFFCDEYILESDYKPNLLFYITEEYPFTYMYNIPFQFPGFIVSEQSYFGEKEIVETIYNIRQVDCTSEFKNLVTQIKQDDK